MDFSWRFDSWFRGLPKSGKDTGEVTLLVVRPPCEDGGLRETPSSISLTPEGGIEGDKWAESEERLIEAQVSLINVHVVRSLAGSDDRMALSGDNLVVDLDLTEENLPAGTVLRIGSAMLEVSAIPHEPCASFKDRYGATAAKKVGRANRKGKRGRGVMTRILEAGEIKVGDGIIVVRQS